MKAAAKSGRGSAAAALLGDDDLRRHLTLALLDRQFARGQIGGDAL